MSRTYPLEGIKVVDFSWVFTGPIAAKYLGEHGAEIVKIESARRTDGTRMMTPFKGDIRGLNRSGLFANYNSSKFSVNINLGHPKGREIARRLVARADVVLETYGPGVMKNWGLHYEELRKVKPDIIMTSMSMFGQYGPYSRQPTYGQLLQGHGFVNILGWPDRPPSLPVAAYTDFIAPWFVVMVIVAALDYRRRTGEGQYIDLAMQEASVHLLTPMILDYAVNNRIQTRMGNRCPGAAPHGVYPCVGHDRWCSIAVFTDEEWQALCRVMGNPEWAQSQKFATLAGRTRHIEELDALMAGWTAQYSAEEVMAMLQAAGVPSGVAQTAEDLVEHDLQLRHRQHFVTLDHPEMGDHLSERPPFRLSKTPSEPQRPAPCFGEHTEYVCRELLGMSDEEFAELVAADALV